MRLDAVAGRDGNADARADHNLLAVDVVRRRERRDQPPRESGGLARRREWPLQDDELVAAETRDDVAVAKRRLEPRRDLDEERIATRVAEGVVDLLELVEVDEHHCELPGACDVVEPLSDAL